MRTPKRGARNQTSARQAAGRGRGGGVASGGLGGQQGIAAPGIGMSNTSTTSAINNNSVITTAVNQQGGVVTNLTVPDLGSLNPVAPSQVVLPTQPYQQMVNAVPQTVTAQMGTGQPIHQQQQYQQQQHSQQQQHHQVLQQHQQQQQMHLLQPGAMTGQKLIRRGHQVELLTQAKFLCDRQDFVDLTIYCEDGVVRAHQMLLAVASPFLKLLFQTSPLYGTDEISLILPEVKACLVQALIHFVYTGTVVSKEDHFYSLMKLVYALNINASIEAESTNDRPTTFTAPLVPPHSLNPVLRLPQQTPQYLSQQQNLQVQQFQNQQQHFQQPQSNLQQQQLQQQQNQLLQNSLPQAILPTQPVPLQQAMNGLPISSSASANNAAALVAQITQPAMAPPNSTGPPNKLARLSGPPANAVPLPPQNLPGLTNLSPSKLSTTNSLPNIQLPTQPVPMVNGVLKGSDAPAAGQVTQQHLQQNVNQQQVQQQQQQQQQQQFAIAVDPTTGISYKVDMTNGQMMQTSELNSSDPLAAIMNETIFTDTSGAIVPAPNAAMYTTDNGQVIYTTQPPPNATATIPTNMPISQGTQLITSPSGNIQLASPQQLQPQQGQGQSDGSVPGTNANRGGARGGAGTTRGGRQNANSRGTKRKNPSQAQNNNQVNNSNLANNNRTDGVLPSGGDDTSVVAESVDDLPCAPDDEDINTPYPCPSCNKTIKGRVMLQAHHFQEHYENPDLGTTMQASANDKHACRVCLKFFTRNSDVKAHILRVHCGDRRYPCTMCGKRFKESTHLRKHLYTHTGERPHYCSLCNKGFQTSSDLKRHKRTRVHQERVEQAGGIDPIDTAPPASAAATTAATAAAAVANTGAGTPGGFTTDDDSSLSGVQLVHNTSNNSSVGGGPNDAGSTAQALLNSITEPVPVVPSGQVVVGSSMIGTSGPTAATSVVTMVAPTSSKAGNNSFVTNVSTIDMKIIGNQQQPMTYVNNTSGGGIVSATGGPQPSSVVASVGTPLDLKDLTAGTNSATNDDAAKEMADMNEFIENAAREATGSSDTTVVSSMPVVSTNGGPPLSLAHGGSESNSTTAATVVVSAPGTVSQTQQHSLNMSVASGVGNVVNHQSPMVVSAGPPTPTESDLSPQGMPVVTTEASSSSLISNATMNNQQPHLNSMKTSTITENKTGLIQSLGSGRTSAQPATVIVSASHSSNNSNSSMPTIPGVGPSSNTTSPIQKSNSAFDDLKRSSSLDSPGHDEERLTVVETMDESSQENVPRHPAPAAVVVPLIKSKVDSSSPSS